MNHQKYTGVAVRASLASNLGTDLFFAGFDIRYTNATLEKQIMHWCYTSEILILPGRIYRLFRDRMLQQASSNNLGVLTDANPVHMILKPGK